MMLKQGYRLEKPDNCAPEVYVFWGFSCVPRVTTIYSITANWLYLRRLPLHYSISLSFQLSNNARVLAGAPS